MKSSFVYVDFKFYQRRKLSCLFILRPSAIGQSAFFRETTLSPLSTTNCDHFSRKISRGTSKITRKGPLKSWKVKCSKGLRLTFHDFKGPFLVILLVPLEIPFLGDGHNWCNKRNVKMPSIHSAPHKFWDCPSKATQKIAENSKQILLSKVIAINCNILIGAIFQPMHCSQKISNRNSLRLVITDVLMSLMVAYPSLFNSIFNFGNTK